MEEKLKIFKISRIRYGFEEDYEMLVLALDEKEALRIARDTSWDFEFDRKKDNFVVKEIDMDKARAISVLRSR